MDELKMICFLLPSPLRFDLCSSARHHHHHHHADNDDDGKGNGYFSGLNFGQV